MVDDGGGGRGRLRAKVGPITRFGEGNILVTSSGWGMVKAEPEPGAVAFDKRHRAEQGYRDKDMGDSGRAIDGWIQHAYNSRHSPCVPKG